VAQVHHFGALRLDQAAHDVDRGVVAVEQAGASFSSSLFCARNGIPRRSITKRRRRGLQLRLVPVVLVAAEAEQSELVGLGEAQRRVQQQRLREE
jgi:hypothetical protein